MELIQVYTAGDFSKRHIPHAPIAWRSHRWPVFLDLIAKGAEVLSVQSTCFRRSNLINPTVAAQIVLPLLHLHERFEWRERVEVGRADRLQQRVFAGAGLHGFDLRPQRTRASDGRFP